jgi:hypothetical protein
MIRYKILGADGFYKALPMQQTNINYDMGNFSIGTTDNLDISFDEVLPPPKQLWIKAKIEFNLNEDIAVIQEGNSFVWYKDGSRCSKVTVTPTQIIYAQKDNLVTSNWQLVAGIFEHHFATVPTIYAEQQDEAIGFWPCGGKVSGNFLEVKQLYGQVSGKESEQKVYVNSLSACSKLLSKVRNGANFLFHPPLGQKLSLAAAIGQGLMVVKIADGNLQYLYKSVSAENTENDSKFMQILFERKDQ